MNRREAPDSSSRTKRSKSFASTYVGNNRQMLQDIRDSLSHVRSPTSAADPSSPSPLSTTSSSSKSADPMQIKGSEGSNNGGSSSSSTTNPPDPRGGGSAFKSNAYRQKALAEIRNSLQPFANTLNSGASSQVSTLSSSGTTSGVSSASGLSTASGSSSPCPSGPQQQQHNGFDCSSASHRQLLQNLQQMGYTEELVLRAMKMPPGRTLDVDALQRLSHDGANCSQKMARRQSFEHEYVLQRGSPATLDGSTTGGSTRSDSPSCGPMQHRSAYGEPPRLHSQQPGGDGGHLPLGGGRQYSPSFGMEPPPPPPPPPRPAGPPTPTRGTTPPPSSVSSQSPFAASPQVQHMLKRISPVPQNSRPPALGYGLSQSTTPQRGTSPSGRVPVVVHNSQQLQQQITQQLHNMTMTYNGGGSSSVSSVSSGGDRGGVEPPPPYPLGGGGSKMTSPLSFVVTPQSRQSPSQSPVLDLGQSVGVKRVAPLPTYQPGVGVGLATSQPVVGSVATSRPVALQAWSTRQPPIIMQSVKSTQVQKPVLQTAVAPSAPPPPSYVASIQQQQQQQLGGSDGSPVPTTDPPSYASSIQAMVASASNSAAATATNVCHSSLTSYNLMHHHNHQGAPSPVEPPRPKPCPTPPASDVGSSVSSTEPQLPRRAHPPPPMHHQQLQRKFSSPSPLDAGGPPPLPPSSSGRPRPPSPAYEHGLAQQEGPGRPPPPPPPPPHKTTLHSPIPERKRRGERDEESLETCKVRNYSPQAYKFFMEQHMENVFKSQQQRLHRRVQLEAEMAKVGLSEEAQCQMRRMLHQKESNYIRLKRAKMDKAMFVRIKTIGVGAFGEVTLVRKIDTQHLYAMKTLRKVDVLQRNQVAHVKAERDILAEADNEWVVKLYYSFQDKDNLYFVMDYIPGGDLMSLLIKFGIFKESLARFYVAELLCAIESVHKMGFIHRDIKPDNILIDRDGHIKLTDFGLCTGFRWTHNSKYYQRNGEHSRQDSMDPDENWSNECRCHEMNMKPLERRRLRREHQRCLAHSLVGTPNYIAPEVLMRTGYTQLCDWWSVGVILYEMLVGQPPFLANTPAETQFKVINWESSLCIPPKSNLSSEATDLILKLCARHDLRLGRNGATEIKQHPFFGGVDFDGGLRRQRAPYVPTIRHLTDTSNFDPIDPDKLRNSDGSEDSRADHRSDDGRHHPEHAFYEFTFRRFFDDGGHAYPARAGGAEENDGQNPVYV